MMRSRSSGSGPRWTCHGAAGLRCPAVVGREDVEQEHLIAAGVLLEDAVGWAVRGADPGTVVQGQVRLVAAVATRQRSHAAHDLLPVNLPRWQELRRQLGVRRDPAAYLAALEDQLLKLTLPA